jgi:predicted secreted protein
MSCCCWPALQAFDGLAAAAKKGQQHVTSRTVASLLHSVLSIENKPSAGIAQFLQPALLERICDLPAADQLNAAQVCELLLTAVQHGQKSAVPQLCALSGASQLSSDEAKTVGLAAVQLGSSSVTESLHGIWDLLQPEHMLQLLQHSMLLATLGGEFEQLWCDFRMRKHHREVPPSPWGDNIGVVSELCYFAAAQEQQQQQQQQQLQKPHINQLLLTAAAALGNAMVLTILFECLDLDDVAGANAGSEWQPSSEAALQLLDTSLQHRNSSMLETVLYRCDNILAMGYSKAMLEVTTALIRTDDRRLLLHMLAALAGWMPPGMFAEENLPQLLQVAVQLGRTGILREVCDNSGRPHWLQPARQLRVIGRVSQYDYEELIKQAVRSNDSSMVRCLMGLPPASSIEGGALQLVMDECRRLGQLAGSSRHVKAGWLLAAEAAAAGKNWRAAGVRSAAVCR